MGQGQAPFDSEGAANAFSKKLNNHGDGSDRVVQVVTAGVSLGNSGAADVAGLVLHHAARQRLVRLGDSN